MNVIWTRTALSDWIGYLGSFKTRIIFWLKNATLAGLAKQADNQQNAPENLEQTVEAVSKHRSSIFIQALDT